MKKGVVVIFFAVLLFSFVVGQENETNLSDSLKGISEKINMSDIQSNLVLPDFVQEVTRFIFQVEEDKEIGIEYFIVLIGVFVIILAIISGVIYMTPLHREPVEIFIFKFNTDYLMGGIITLIVALTGVINLVVADWVFSLELYRELVSKLGWGVHFPDFVYLNSFILCCENAFWNV